MSFKYTLIQFLAIITMKIVQASEVKISRLYQTPKEEDELEKDPTNNSPIVWVVLGAAGLAVFGGCIYVWVKMCRDAFG